MSGKTTNLKRRNFLLSVGLGGAGAAAGVIGGKAMLEQQAEMPAKESSAKGYRLSEHVQNYYRTTRV
jgi:hypothetical protein